MLAQDGLTLEGTRPPFRAPSYSTVDKLLKLGFPLDVKTFPYRLRCVAEEKGKDGRVRLIPYEEWEDRLAAKERRGGKAAERNNCPRRYYLANAPEYTPRPGQMVEASMSVAPAGAKLFALQYIGSVEVLEPESLRQEIAQELEAALNTYRS